MTRINANIDPVNLIDQHLLAEYREIVRIPNASIKYYNKYKKGPQNAPKHFKLGNGHVLYFYDKLQFLHKRYLQLKEELKKRNFECNMDDSMFDNIPVILYKDCDISYYNDIVYVRIIERMLTMKSIPKYYKKQISLNEYLHFLNL